MTRETMLINHVSFYALKEALVLFCAFKYSFK